MTVIFQIYSSFESYHFIIINYIKCDNAAHFTFAKYLNYIFDHRSIAPIPPAPRPAPGPLF